MFCAEPNGSRREERRSQLKVFLRIAQYCYNRPFLGYLALICLVFWPLSFGVYALQYDAIDVYLPWRFFGSEVLQNGGIPLWNPFQDGGYPFYTDHQYSIWSPEFLIVSLFGRYNALTIQWLYLFYLVLGGMGFRYLIIELGISIKTAFYGGVLFMLSGVMIGHAQSIVSILGAVWLPWSLGAYIRLLKDNFEIRSVLRSIICIFLMLTAGYQAVSIMLFYVLLTLGLYQLIVLIKTKNWRDTKRFLTGHFVLGLILGLLLLGTILSLIEVSPYLTRLSGLSVAETQKFIFHPKALLSVLYPMASVKQEISGMDVSTQNVFSGTVALFALIFAGRYYKKKHSPQILILLIFGLIYGLASLGPHTFVQPLFAQYLPGFDLFYYAAFYRLFTWIALLILSCIGLEYFLKEGKKRYVIYFLSSVAIVYGVSIIASWEAWSEISESWTPNWIATFRGLSPEASLLIQSLVQMSIATVFGCLYFLTSHKKVLLSIFLVTELAIISQFNIPISVHGSTRTASIDNYLATKKSGFSLLNEFENIGISETEGQFGPIWRNQGNFTNLPALNGWTSFHLADRDDVYHNHPELSKNLMMKPFVYINSRKGRAKLIEFEPNQFKVEFSGAKKLDTLVIQQAKYPGWEAVLDTKQVDIFKGNVFEQFIPISESGTLIMRFKNDSISVLFYVTHLGFMLLLITFMLVSWKPSKKYIHFALAMVSVIFISIRLLQFANAEHPETSFEIRDGETSIAKFSSRLNDKNKEDIFKAILGTPVQNIVLDEKALDIDFDVLAMLNHSFENVESTDIGDTYTRMAFSKRQFSENLEVTQMDSTLIYFNNTQHVEWPELREDMRVLTAGITVEEMDSDGEVFLILEIVNHGTQSFYQTHKLNPIQFNGKGFIRKGFLLPNMSTSDELKVYLWNNSGKSFAFSSFNLNYIDLPR